MNWHWYRNIVTQWQQNQRLRYAVLMIIVILVMHGILKIADQRDELVKTWAKDQDLLTRLQEVAQQPAWPARAETAQSRLRAMVMALPLASSQGQAQADQHMWLADIARRSKLETSQVTVEDALEVPEEPGLVQVVARLEAQDLPWKFAPALRRVAQGLPWRQVQRMEISAGTPGKISLIVRSYYRDATVELPAMPEPLVKQRVGAAMQASSAASASRASARTPAAPVTSTNAAGAAAPAAVKSPSQPVTRRGRELPVPQAVGIDGAADQAGVVEGVLEPSGKPPSKREGER